MSIEEIIKRAEREGAFENLKGKGKPLEHIDTRADPAWWLSQKLKEEGLSLPPPEAIAQRRELDRIGELGDEAAVRRDLALLNVRIVTSNRRGLSGMPGQLAPIDIDGYLQRWRARRHL